MQADIPKLVSKQLEEQRQKQDGSEPAALIVTTQPSVRVCLCTGPYSRPIVCLLLCRLPLLEQRETIGHENTNSHKKEMRNPAFLEHGCPAVPHTPKPS